MRGMPCHVKVEAHTKPLQRGGRAPIFTNDSGKAFHEDVVWRFVLTYDLRAASITRVWFLLPGRRFVFDGRS